jgi:signal peptidase II
MLQIIIIVLQVVADQLSKFLIFPGLETLPGQTMPLIKDVFHLTYIKNEGASFGMLQGMQWLFIVVTILVLIATVYIMIKYRNKHSRFVKVCIAVLFSGALGNLIDRIAFGYVRDFLDFRLFDFWKWVFNIADASLVIGAILLGIYILFIYKDNRKHLKETVPNIPEDNESVRDDGSDTGEQTKE